MTKPKSNLTEEDIQAMCTDESFTLVQKGKYLLKKGTNIQIKSVIETFDMYLSEQTEIANKELVPLLA